MVVAMSKVTTCSSLQNSNSRCLEGPGGGPMGIIGLDDHGSKALTKGCLLRGIALIAALYGDIGPHWVSNSGRASTWHGVGRISWLRELPWWWRS